MDLSIIIPALNESTKIAGDIASASAFMHAVPLTGQIIVSDDGSTDGTAEIARKCSTWPGIEITVVRSDRNKGKGAAVKAGVLASSGDFVLLADSGRCVPFGNAMMGLEIIKAGKCDIACGSRRMILSDIRADQPLHRKISSLAFRRFVRAYMQMPELTDTQCGFKLFPGKLAKELFTCCSTDGFMFDIEIILLAAKKGYKIAEFPVEWSCDPDSRLSVSRSLFTVLAELAQIKKKLRSLAE